MARDLDLMDWAVVLASAMTGVSVGKIMEDKYRTVEHYRRMVSAIRITDTVPIEYGWAV